MALRPRPTAAVITSRYGSHALARGARLGFGSVDTWLSLAGFAAAESVDTCSPLAGFASADTQKRPAKEVSTDLAPIWPPVAVGRSPRPAPACRTAR
jgi:hypothetical protein